MKRVLLVCIPIVILSVAIILVIMNTNKGLTGTISSIDEENRIITIQDAGQETKLQINNNTKLLDVRNQPTIFSEFNIGFEVEAIFKNSGEILKVEKIKITKAPNIVILSPKDKESVNKEFTITGLARVFENVLQVEIKDKANGQSLYKKNIMASPLDIGLFGPFETQVNLTEYAEVRSIEVIAFQYSAKDGSVIDKTTITLDLK